MENNQNNIFDANEDDFNEKIIDASSSSLILVDFWAPWCGPCKQLTPILEKIIKKAKGKVKLAKINIDENKQIAAQLRIQSIPAVFAFKEKKPVDAFQGVIPENKIIEFIEKSLGESLGANHDDFYQNIKSLFEKKEFHLAINELENFIAKYPEEFKGIGIYLECLIHLNKLEDADNLIESLNDKALDNETIQSAIKQLTIKKKNIKGPSLEVIKKQFENNQDKIENIVKLADKYFAENMYDNAFELLLAKYGKNKAIIKVKFLEFFEILGNDHIKTSEFRKKFSSIMFS